MTLKSSRCLKWPTHATFDQVTDRFLGDNPQKTAKRQTLTLHI